VADIIDFAIRREEEAARGYGEMADAAKMPGLKELLLELKRDEENHKRILENFSAGELDLTSRAEVPDLKISDFVAEEPMDDDMSFQDLLLFAARKEKKAVELYERLAALTEGDVHKKTFEFLASQEREHKFKLEAEYEKRVFEEN
jgi:rubrerythrin